MEVNQIILGDSLKTLKTLSARSVDCCVTSPPYFNLRNYDHIAGQIGLEKTPEEYVDRLVKIFDEIRRVLKDTGTLWVNIGDTYAGGGRAMQGENAYAKHVAASNYFKSERHKSKSLIGIPWLFAFAMVKHWILRQDIIWAKRNPMPEPVKDRFCRSHEHLFLFTKQPKYYFDHSAALEEATGYDGRGMDAPYIIGDYQSKIEGRAIGSTRRRWVSRGYILKPDNTGLRPQHHGQAIAALPFRTKRDVWFISTEPSKEKHYAMYPQKLIEPCILCGCPPGGIVLDQFLGSGTTAIAAKKSGRKYLGCEINPHYVEIAKQRLAYTPDPLPFERRCVDA